MNRTALYCYRDSKGWLVVLVPGGGRVAYPGLSEARTCWPNHYLFVSLKGDLTR